MADVDPLITRLPLLTASVDARQLKRLTFLSDVHLQATEQSTFRAWADHLLQVQADAMFILGDLFEVWIGDDLLLDPQAEFERDCLQRINALSQRMPVYWMAGNRDFLLGDAACTAAGMQALNDPCVLHTADGNCVLSHGDALCLADTEYLDFRRMVRSPEWQQHFLAKPLHERLLAAQHMRAQSEARKATQSVWTDVDTNAAVNWLTQHQAFVLVHGHTHHPANHTLAPGLQRCVLSDWEADAQPPRLQAFSWEAGRGFERTALNCSA
jgi:UDP-2,3-diacylglucosamine hydrolase